MYREALNVSEKKLFHNDFFEDNKQVQFAKTIYS